MTDRRPAWTRGDRAWRLAWILGAVLGILAGGLSAPFGIFPR